MTIMIRVVGWLDVYDICVIIFRTSLFFRVSTYDPRWLHVKAPKKPPISNSKIPRILESQTISKFDQNYREKHKEFLHQIGIL